MTVAQLIAALSSLPPSSQVLMDIPYTPNTAMFCIQGTMVAPTIVAQGLTYKLYEQNAGMGVWVDTDPNYWTHFWTSLQTAYPSVYIGVGNGITENKWGVAFPSGV
jgi:hypothetical protein